MDSQRCWEKQSQGVTKKENEQKKGKPLVLVSRFKYLEWGGTRKHPYASEVQAKGTITIKGLTATIEMENGVKFQKRMTTKGFEVDCIKMFRF